MPLSRLFELFTPTGVFGSGLRLTEKPTLSTDLTDASVSDRSMGRSMEAMEGACDEAGEMGKGGEV